MYRPVLTFVALISPAFVVAQTPTAETSKFKPRALPHFAMSFQNVSVAKAAADKTSIMLLVPQFKYETRTATYTVVVTRDEKRVRTVTDDAGNTKEVEYVVKVPVTEERTQEYTVSIPIEPKKVTLPIADVRAWEVTGQSVEAAELLRRLAEPTHLFAAEMDPAQEFVAIEPYFAEILKAGALVLYVAPGKIYPVPAVEEPLRPAPAAPVPVPAPPAP